MTIKVGGFRVLVKPVDIEEVDDAYASAKRVGIQLISEAKDREQAAVDKGIVIQIGNTVANEFDGDLWFSEGDFVLFARYSGKRVKDPETEEEYIVFNGEDILCVIENPDGETVEHE